ncbi:hypothetical protein V3C33_15330 [Micrococcaceae bacterium Sec5.7]
MNNQSIGQDHGQSGDAPKSAQPGVQPDSAGPQTGQKVAATAGGSKTAIRNEAVLGPFTVRDLTVFAATLILFVASLLPMFTVRYNLWNMGSLFFLGLGIVLPLIVTALFVARRLSPETTVRVGSLSIDQLGSVVASFAVAFFFVAVAAAFVPSMLVALIGSLLLFAATVLGRFIPFFAGDFQNRAEFPAHIVARDAAAPTRKPKAPHEPKAPKQAKPSTDGPTEGGPVSQAGTPAAHTGVVPGPAGTAPDSAAWPATNTAPGAPGTGAPAVVPSATEPSVSEPPAADASAPERSSVSEPSPSEPSSSAASAATSSATPAVATPPAAEETRLDGTPVTAGSPADSGNGADAAGHAGNGTPTESAAKPAAAEPLAATTANPLVRSHSPIGATVDPASRPEESDHQPVHEAFWFAVSQYRTAVDPRTGAPVFGIEPGGWVLALEDRGHEFLVQHTDGRVGVLRDLSNIERG